MGRIWRPRVRALVVAALFLVFAGVGVYTNTRAQVQAAASSTLNFQARLLMTSGAPVPDGDYHIEFKLYDDATAGSLLWTETRTTGNLVEVRNGYLSVYLGDVSALPTTGWDSQRWITMNIGGTAGAPTWDGEMLNGSNERMLLTAVPYAFAARGLTTTNGANTATLDFTTPTNDRTITLPDASGVVCLEGSADCDFVQIAPLSIQTINSAGAAIQINQQGSGGLLQLQSGGVDRATIAANGNTFLAGTLDIDGGSLNIGSASVLGAMVFNDGSSNTLSLQPGSMAADLVLTLPTADGNIGDCLKTDGAGALSFGACGGGAAITKVKTVSETENSTTNPTATLQPDDELFFAIGANETWTVRFSVQANVNATPDIKFAVAAPVGATCVVSVADVENAVGISNLGCGVSSGSIAGLTANDVFEVTATITNGTNAGNVTLQWAQNAAGAQNTVVLAGSSLTATSTTSTGSAIIQDGNTFGAPITIGSNDSNALNLETNGTTRLTIDAAGNITAVGDVAVQGSFTLGDANTDRITVNGQIAGASPFTFQGASDNANTTTFTFAEPTAVNSITFPDASGTVCLTTSGCAVSGGTAGGDLSGTYPNPTVARINGATLGTTTATTGNILVADGSLWSSVAMSGDATINSTGAITINNDAVTLGTDTTGDFIATIASGSGLSVSGSGGEGAAATVALGALTTDWSQSGAFDISLGNASSELRIMESTGGTFYAMLDADDLTANRSLVMPDEDGTICVRNSLNCGFVMFDEAAAQVDGGTNTSLFINKTGATGNILNLQDSGTDVFTVNNDGGVDINSASATALQVNNGGVRYMTVDSTTSEVYVGSTTTDTTQVLFQLDSFSTYDDTAACTTTSNQGGLYYNTNTNAMRACINGSWEDLLSTQGLGLLMFGVVPDSSNAGTPGDIGGVTGNANGPCSVTWTTANTVTVNPCIAYSGGRKVIVASTVISVAAMANNNYANICLTGANGQPALGTANATETTAATPTFSANNPVLCLATVRTQPGGTLSNIWDVRTFTTTQKVFTTINSVNTIGYMVIGTATSNVTQTTAALSNGPIRGIVVASTRTASTTTVNAILAMAGHQYVKISAGATANVNAVVQTNNVAGYARTNTTFTTSYSSAGVLQKAVSTTCNAVTNCQYSGLVDLQISR